jgi:hypothetical protein
VYKFQEFHKINSSSLTNTLQVPHLIAPVQDGGWALLNKLYANKRRELSGTPLYFTTFGLAFLSIPWMRRRFYEAFKYVHIILGVSYIALLWWHTWGEYMSVSVLFTLHQTTLILLFSLTMSTLLFLFSFSLISSALYTATII